MKNKMFGYLNEERLNAQQEVIFLDQLPAQQAQPKYKNRVINMFGQFDEARCNAIVEQLLQWEEEDGTILYNHYQQLQQTAKVFAKGDNEKFKEYLTEAQPEDPSELLKPIIVNINSPGGRVDGLMAIVDMLYAMDAPVITRVMGEACSCGFVLFCAGDERYVGRNASLMYHEMTYVMVDKLRDQESYLKFSKKLQKKLDKIIANNTGVTLKTLDEWKKGPDKWMDAEEAVKLGIATDFMY